MLLKVFLSSLVLTQCCLGFEMVDQSPSSVMVPEGGAITLQCTTDEPWNFCTWHHIQSGIKCSVSSDDIATASACKQAERVAWVVDEHSCGIVIEGANRETDKGEYICALLKMNEDMSTVDTKSSSTVDLAVESKVEFKGVFAIDDIIPTAAGEVTIVECHATGGYPDPQVKAAVGSVAGLIDEVSDRLLMEAEGTEGRAAYEDGSVDVTKNFVLAPGLDDDLKYVKCEAVQYDSDGSLLFQGGSSVTSRQIEVRYAPQPLEQNLRPYQYVEGQGFVQIDINFAANPVPENNQAIWHIGKGAGAEVAVQAGDTLGKKYEALELIRFENNITASFTIYNLTSDDEKYSYYLKVVTSLGETNYEFRLEMSEIDSIVTPAPGGPDVVASGLSGGAIAGIIICVIIVLLLVGFAVWCKVNEKFCFETQKPKKPKQNAAANAEEGAAAEERGQMMSGDNNKQSENVD